jgi:hypothetical protein
VSLTKYFLLTNKVKFDKVEYIEKYEGPLDSSYAYFDVIYVW